VSVLVAGSAKGSPGVTTSLLALALTWPREALFVEADPAGGDIRAGLLQAQTPPGRDLLGLALASRRGDPDAAEHAIALHDDRLWVVPGLTDPAQREAVLPVWPRVVSALMATRRDVLVDAGRLDSPAVLVPAAEPAVVLLAVAPTLAGVDRAYPASTGPGVARIGLLVVGDGPYPAGELAKALDTSVLGVLPADPGAARTLASGHVPWRSPLLRAARDLAPELAALLRPAADLATAGA
jgi:hypothetical protein